MLLHTKTKGNRKKTWNLNLNFKFIRINPYEKILMFVEP